MSDEKRQDKARDLLRRGASARPCAAFGNGIRAQTRPGATLADRVGNARETVAVRRTKTGGKTIKKDAASTERGVFFIRLRDCERGSILSRRSAP